MKMTVKKETLPIKSKTETITDCKYDYNLNWFLVFGVVLLLTIGTRFYKVTEPDHVCWDETHFGKMGSWYINRTFFFDVHPPLGKMLIALSGYLTGYNGTYPFEKPGDKYNGAKYEGMRYFCTTLGALIIPMAFDTVSDLTHSLEAATVAASYLIFDIGMLTLNQYILLDPILLFFMTASVWGMTKVAKNTKNEHSYSLRWWIWLFFTGTMLACTISVKFVGLFVVLLVGLHTANELWLILGQLDKPVMETVKQILCRAVTLIIWPIALYTLFFYIHLAVLNETGNGDGFYSSAFQSRLKGNSLYNASMPRDVAYGSVISIKNHKTGGGYLHSHTHLYPKGLGALQQQITSYTHKDDNNFWRVKPSHRNAFEKTRLLRNGQLIRLEHLATKRNLHSHEHLAPITKKHFQVTAYGEEGVGDANDIWKIVVPGGKVNQTVRTVTTRFQLIHHLQNCALTTSGKQLPKWGFEQQETSCNTNLRDQNSYWNIEFNHNPKLRSENFSIYAPGFFARFIESHAVMFQGNSGLKPKEGEVTSRPWQWPILYRGQFFSGYLQRIYLLGNPIIWWSNLIFMVLFIFIKTCSAIKDRRREGREYHQLIQLQLEKEQETNQHVEMITEQTELSNEETEVEESHTIIKNHKKVKEDLSLQTASWLFLAWLLHYVPFWGMGRVLYFHHYFPALIFNSMLTGVMFHYISRRLPTWFRHILLGFLLSVLVYTFKIFSPLSYGLEGSVNDDPDPRMDGLKWLRTWEF